MWFALGALLTCTLGAGAATQDPNPSPEKVARAVEGLRTSSPNDDLINAGINLGGILLRSGRYNEAAELFSVLAQKRPNDSGVLYGWGLAIFNAGRSAEAEPIARRAVEAATADTRGSESAQVERSADTLVLWGTILAVKGDDAAAVKTLQRAVRLAPNHFDAQFALGRALYGIGDDAGAARAFRIARSLQPANPQAMFFLATTLERAGEVQDALKTYRELIAFKPDMFEGHLGLGVLLLKRNPAAGEEGLKELERALQINPNLYEAHIAAGRALIARGRPLDAVPHLLRAAELDSNNPEPHYQLQLAYGRLGRKQDAANEAAIVKRIHETRRGGRVSAQSRVEFK